MLAKFVYFGHYTQMIRPDSVLPAVAVSCFDLYHSISLTVTLTEGHKVSIKQNLKGSSSVSVVIEKDMERTSALTLIEKILWTVVH